MSDTEPNDRASPSAAARSTRGRRRQELIRSFTDPVRSAILARLVRADATAAELAIVADVSVPKVRNVLRRMREAGVIEVIARDGGDRGRENVYSVDPAALIVEEGEMLTLPFGRRDEINARSLRGLLAEMRTVARGGRISVNPEHVLVRFPIRLDDKGWEEAAAFHRQTLHDLLEVRGESEKRRLVTGEEAKQTLAAILLFERTDVVASAFTRAPGQPSKDHFTTEPQRLSITTALMLSPAGARELAERLELPIEKVRYHLQRLSQEGQLEVHSERPRRGTVERIYVANSRQQVHYGRWSESAGVREVVEMQTINVVFREALATLQAGAFHRREGGALIRFPMPLDRRGISDAVAAFEVTLERLFALKDECARRLEQSGEPGLTATSALFYFEYPE